MPEHCEVRLVLGHRKELLDTAVAHQHDQIPDVVWRSDQIVTAVAEKRHFASGRFDVGSGLCDVPLVGCSSADRRCGRELGMR